MRPTYGDEVRWFLERSELYKERAELRADVERLRGALEQIAWSRPLGGRSNAQVEAMEQVAIAALRGNS